MLKNPTPDDMNGDELIFRFRSMRRSSRNGEWREHVDKAGVLRAVADVQIEIVETESASFLHEFIPIVSLLQWPLSREIISWRHVAHYIALIPCKILASSSGLSVSSHYLFGIALSSRSSLGCLWWILSFTHCCAMHAAPRWHLIRFSLPAA